MKIKYTQGKESVRDGWRDKRGRAVGAGAVSGASAGHQWQTSAAFQEISLVTTRLLDRPRRENAEKDVALHLNWQL